MNVTEEHSLLTAREAELLFDKITFEKECWIWNAAVNQSGVPVFKFRGKTTAARTVLNAHYRVLEKNYRTCRVEDCVNPAHRRSSTP